MIYGTLAASKAYHADRGNTVWASASDSDLTAALVRATDYIDSRYRYRYATGRWVSMFPGERTNGRDQELEWPRTNAVDYDGRPIDSGTVPVEVERATYVAALFELQNPNGLSPSFVPSQVALKEKVGPIEVQYSEKYLSENPVRPKLTHMDELLAPVLIKPELLPAVMVI